jgi:hypothetical protein
MRYIKVAWLHDYSHDPVLVYSEIGADGYETRKVELFRDGTMTFADEKTETGSTGLGEVPVPPLEEIAADTEERFVPEFITRDEFERVWTQAQG